MPSSIRSAPSSGTKVLSSSNAAVVASSNGTKVPSSINSTPIFSSALPPSTGRKSARATLTSSKGKIGKATPVHVPFTLTSGSLPCVMVDTEPKVIRRCLDAKHGSTLLVQGVSKESCIWDKAGRGNNWAYGYHGSGGSGAVLERVREAVRKVVERCDRFSGFVMFHSIAGGTGSGEETRYEITQQGFIEWMRGGGIYRATPTFTCMV